MSETIQFYLQNPSELLVNPVFIVVMMLLLTVVFYKLCYKKGGNQETYSIFYVVFFWKRVDLKYRHLSNRLLGNKEQVDRLIQNEIDRAKPKRISRSTAIDRAMYRLDSFNRSWRS